MRKALIALAAIAAAATAIPADAEARNHNNGVNFSITFGDRTVHHGNRHHFRHSVATPRIDARQERQARRIRRGVRSGALNRAERQRLIEGQRRVARLERRFKADGRITRAERARLVNALDVQSERIFRLKHNRF